MSKLWLSEASMDDELQQLLAAFEAGNLDCAVGLGRKLSGEAREGRDRGLEQIISDLWAKADSITDPQRSAAFAAAVKELVSLIWVRQDELQRAIVPRLRSQGNRYRKFRQVHAKKASGGEVVVSVTGDGRETENMATAGDYIVRNTTSAGEEYIVGAEKFQSRYRYIADLNDGWRSYKPTSAVRAVVVDEPLLATLERPDLFYIEAPWGAAQRVRKGDRLVASDDDDGVYRIAAAEFRETYDVISARSCD